MLKNYWNKIELDRLRTDQCNSSNKEVEPIDLKII